MKIEENEYWRGPADVYIPVSKTFVPSIDGVNIAYQDGSETERASADPNHKPYTKKEYRNKFAKYKNGLWFWKEK